MPPKAIVSQKPQSVWLPDLNPKQFEVFGCYKRFLMCDGPRISGKSLAISNKCVRHAFDNDGACIAIIGKTLRNAFNGAWRDLTRIVIPQWIKAGLIRWIVPPAMLADSKMRYCIISNRYGGESEIQLHSLEHELEADEKFRDTRFSMIYLVEADKHRIREPFEVLSLQLRSLQVDDSQMMLVCDTNPPEAGKNHWLWDVFVKKTGFTDADQIASDNIHRIHFTLADNPKAPPGIVQSLKAMYRYDKTKYARYVEGEWVIDSESGHFSDVFRPDIHVIGDTSSRDKSEWETLVPPPNTYELYDGYDLGEVFHAAVIACKRNVGDVAHFDIIDELVVLDKHISLADFAEAMMEKREFWQKFCEREYGLKKPLGWKSWSDNSAMRYRSALGSHEALEILKLTGGQIKLRGAFKGKGAIGERIGLVKKLLFENRLFFSADCFHVQDMIRTLKSGIKRIEMARPDVIEKGSLAKHVFDSMTYLLGEECPNDIEYSARPFLRRTGSKRTGLISIGL